MITLTNSSKAFLWTATGLLLAGTLILFAATFDSSGEQDVWASFLGGFHPVLLHLPIGIVIVIGLKAIGSRWFQPSLAGGDIFFWGLAAVTATTSFATGYLMGGAGGYEAELIQWHLWSAAIFTSFCWLSFIAVWAGAGGVLKVGLLACSLVAMTFAGHYGGLMVHGDPLAAAPWRLDPQRFATLGLLGEEIVVYEDVVRPILGAKCVACHGPAKKNGRLRLDSLEAIRRGGDQGPPVIAGDPAASELIRVIELPLRDDDHMAPAGEPQISSEELAALRYWIEQGSRDDETWLVANAPEALQPILQPGYRILPDPKLEAQRLAREAEESRLAKERRTRLAEEIAALPQPLGASFVFLGRTSDRLSFNPVTYLRSLSGEDLGRIILLLAECEEIDLSRAEIIPSILGGLAQSAHLQRLNLSHTATDDRGVAMLANAPELRSLNLYGTEVSREAVKDIRGFPELRRLYLGGTDLAEADIDLARKRLPHVQVIGDLSLPLPAPPDEKQDDNPSYDTSDDDNDTNA